MADRPILFSTPMIRALIDGRKTMTRRVLKVADDISSEAAEDYELRGYETFWRGEMLCAAKIPYQTGDRLWVRETWRAQEAFDALSPREIGEQFEDEYGTPWCPVFYEADRQCDGSSVEMWQQSPPGKTRVSIHMPRWASRMTLIVDGVGVERLQDISEADAIAEGIEWRYGCWGIWNPDGTMRCGGSPDPIEAFRCLWTNINGNGSWDANPWVSTTSFKVVNQNIDALAADPLPVVEVGG